VHHEGKGHRIKLSGDAKIGKPLLERLRQRLRITEHESVVLVDSKGCALADGAAIEDGAALTVASDGHQSRCEAPAASTVSASESEEEWAEGVATVHQRFRGREQEYSSAVAAFFQKKDCKPLLGYAPRSHADLGECALLAGHLGEAYNSLTTAVSSSSGRGLGAAGYYHLGLAYARLGMHQAAEGSLYQAVHAGGSGPVLIDLAALLLERAHLEAAKLPAPPGKEAVARQLVALCAGNGYTCHKSGLLPNEPWHRDGVPLEIVHRQAFSDADASVPRALVLAMDEPAFIGAGLEYEMVDRRLPLQGIYTAVFHNMRLGAGGLLCNGTHAVSTSRLRRPYPGDLVDNPVCTGKATPIRHFEKALVLLERWGTQWQHFMQDLSHKLVFAAHTLAQNSDMVLILEDAQNENVKILITTILKAHRVAPERIFYFDLGCLTAGRPYCREYLSAREMYTTEVYPVGWIMSAVPQGLGPSFHRALVPLDPPHKLRNKVIILHRKAGSSRSFHNLAQVVAVLSEYALHQGLDPAVEVLYGDEKGRVLQLGKTVSQAAVIVAPHGGQTYNIAFACVGAVFIEVIPALRTHDGPYTIHSYSASLGHRYWMLPVEGHSHRDERPMQVPLDKLRQVLNAARPAK